MKKFLLIAAIILLEDLQAMWLESKIKKLLPKCNYILSAIVREPTEEEKAFPDRTEKSGSPRNISILSTATSRTMHNEMFLLNSPDDHSRSELTITSSIEDDGQSIVSNFAAMNISKIIQEEEIIAPIESSRSIPGFTSAVPLSEEEGIFDMEMSDFSTDKPSVEQSPFEYIPTYYRAKPPCDNAGKLQNLPPNGNGSVRENRRKSSLETYFHAHK